MPSKPSVPPPSRSLKALQGHPVKVLVDASDGADLLVVGNRGHGGFTGMLLGSVSGQVLAALIAPQLSCVAVSRLESLPETGTFD